MFNRSNNNDIELKDKLCNMVKNKPKERGISILKYIKKHIDDDIKTSDNGGNKFGVYERGSYFYMILQDTIDDVLGDISSADSDTPKLDGASIVTKVNKKQPQQKHIPPFETCILVSDKQKYLEKLHELIDNKIGRAVAMVIQAAIDTGGIVKPTSTQVVNEFGNIGNVRGYNNYINSDFSNNDDYKNIKEILSSFVE